MRQRDCYSQFVPTYYAERSDHAFGTSPTRVVAALLLIACVPSLPIAPATEVLAADTFDNGLGGWSLLHLDSASIKQEPGVDNKVLELQPSGKFPPQNQRMYSNVLLRNSRSFQNVRVEGRFQFPTDGDGYLGFIYNHQSTQDRVDFGVIYVKSNGNYVRVSPHYDGNPSWRLYEEMTMHLEGKQRIKTGAWHQFRLDVTGQLAELFLDDMESPVVSFDYFENTEGRIGFEARPGRGEVVWVDDVRVTKLEAAAAKRAPERVPFSNFYGWQAQGPVTRLGGDLSEFPDLSDDKWTSVSPDPRGALISGRLTQSISGDANTLYLRARFDAGSAVSRRHLSISTADKLDVWVNGYYRGTVAPEEYIWSDHLHSDEHSGARLSFTAQPGINTVLFRVHGDRFAGGGFFADLQENR